MRHVLLLFVTLTISATGLGCCHHHARSRGCYDPNTGLVHKKKMFDTCGTGQCGSCNQGCDTENEKWYGDNSCQQKGRKPKQSKQKCNQSRDNCSCRQSRQTSNCECDACCDSNGQYGYNDGALIPYDGSYVDNGMVYEGNAVYEGQYDPNCPTCNQSNPSPTYAPEGNYPELMVPQQKQPQQNQKPAPAPAAEPLPMHETSITIPPASYVVPQPINGPEFPRLQRVSAH